MAVCPAPAEPPAAPHLAALAVLVAGTLAALAAHDWPGKVRELRNIIERALLPGRTLADCLPRTPAVDAARPAAGPGSGVQVPAPAVVPASAPLALDSPPGAGCTVTVRLPAFPGTGAQAAGCTGGSDSSSCRRVPPPLPLSPGPYP